MHSQLSVAWCVPLLSCAFLGMYLEACEGAQNPSPPAPAPVEAGARVEASEPAPLRLEESIASLRPMLGLACSAAESPSQQSLDAVAERAYAQGRLEQALCCQRLSAPQNLSAEHYLIHGRGLLDAKQVEQARELLIQGERRFLGDPRFEPLIERSIDEDPRYAPPIRQLHPDVDLDAIKQLGGGSTIVLRFIKDGETFAAFKPKQKRLQSDPRAEIAAWRLCPLIRCGFNIPYNQPVKLRWRDFDGLYSRIRSESQLAYRANFEDLSLVKEDGVDWVLGVQKDWVPSFTDFPIELTQLWRGWLSLENGEEILEGEARSILSAVRKLHPKGEKLERQLEQHMGELSRRDFARQLSNLLAFDFLINNWDRFSGVPEFWGVNCQFKDGALLSIDNGAAFPRTPNVKVEKQLHRVQRFSRQLVAAVRALEHDKTLARLWPEATPFEKERFETFWAQRQLFLDYVDALIASHGEAAVLCFE